jgi:dTDP-4-amino-4,6-dideoxygalactose transaminase
VPTGARVPYDKGTIRKAFMGEADTYSSKDAGASLGLSDLLAAYPCAQLEQREAILTERKAFFDLELLPPEAGSR